jgi:hypothetical protein
VLFQESGEGALGQTSSSGVGELLHGVKVGVQAGAGVAESAAGNDFAPASGQVTDFLEELGGKFTTRHGPYRLVLAAKVREELFSPLYDTRLCLAKLLMASFSDFSEKKQLTAEAARVPISIRFLTSNSPKLAASLPFFA